MVDQVYYKVQYPLKKSINQNRKLTEQDLEAAAANLTAEDKRKIEKFIEHWNNHGKDKLNLLIKDLKAKK